MNDVIDMKDILSIISDSKRSPLGFLIHEHVLIDILISCFFQNVH
ncbi:hypothetical protein SAMD00020551_4549 [Mesobacillus selenatarsenatis SF-1]|uniref:Uncharacterized protein n=1 Tax=Mesobacillus selenatarsenatis (strain DSM 18680 / JCM 14380 / FERM P-15431 / SF-1) TaxID=1321606 RepID=A0A0A8XAT3_MESS1|nr:hypothetical protein SAMD00020551_4549 [Mesobacillus selenatarsenatis SF-1]